MLEVLRINSPDEKRRLFLDVDPNRETWIVSDLQSKWHLQKDLIERHGVLEQTSVLRATELWQKLAFQIEPDLQPLSVELAQTLFWNWIQEMNLPWARSPHAVPVVLNQMRMWMTLFSDPRHEEIMAQWFEDNQEAYVRWGHWFELCSALWRRCQENNYVMVAWLPAVLLSSDLEKLKWKESLTFDLGPQITQVEGLLIRELSRHMDVKVIFPEAPWLGLMRNTLRPYEVFLAAQGDLNWQPSVSETISFGRFSTQLAELKDAVAQTREWLDRGISPQSIAIVAPDIEEYWPALRLYLKEEGIPFAKPTVAKLGGFLETAQWLSNLRTAMHKIKSNDLEVHLFAHQEKPRLSFDEFKVLFSHIYDASDLKRAADLFSSDMEFKRSTLLTVHEFLAWALSQWDAEAGRERLNAILQVMGKEVPRTLQLNSDQWLSYLEGILARREIQLEGGNNGGIWCVSLSSADWLPVTHAIFLNLNEGALRSQEPSPISAGEAQKIFTDTGYAVGTNDRQELEFEFLWFLQKKWSALRLCFSATDFQGTVLTPSKLWMWAGFVSGQLKKEAEAPRRTRWDEIQALPLETLGEYRKWPAVRVHQLNAALNRDMDITVNSWGQVSIERLSASALERYWNCPFQYAAERQLKLNDDPALDLDMDRRTRGVLLHAMLEKLGAEPFRTEWTDEELVNLIENVRETEKIRIGEERLWPVILAQHLRLGKRFLEMEKHWRSRFPETRTVGREVLFETMWGEVLMSGRLDRVDADEEGRYAVIDYKGSAANLRNWKTWMANHDIQLPLYSLLLEEGRTSLPAGKVMAANYYVVKDADRRKGFHLRDEGAKLYSSQDRHYNFISEAEKQELFQQLKSTIDQAIVEISSGSLNPKPEDLKACGVCSWRALCRSPHLN